jgi:hypothetical protein
LSFSLLSKNLKIKIPETTILLLLYGWGTWCLTLKEEYRLKMYENRVLRRIFGPEEGLSDKCGEDCIMRSFITFTLHKILLG